MNANEAVMMFGFPVFTDHPHSNAAFKHHKSTADRGLVVLFVYLNLLFKNYSGLNNLSERQIIKHFVNLVKPVLFPLQNLNVCLWTDTLVGKKKGIVRTLILVSKCDACCLTKSTMCPCLFLETKLSLSEWMGWFGFASSGNPSFPLSLPASSVVD